MVAVKVRERARIRAQLFSCGRAPAFACGHERVRARARASPMERAGFMLPPAGRRGASGIGHGGARPAGPKTGLFARRRLLSPDARGAPAPVGAGGCETARFRGSIFGRAASNLTAFDQFDHFGLPNLMGGRRCAQVEGTARSSPQQLFFTFFFSQLFFHFFFTFFFPLTFLPPFFQVFFQVFPPSPWIHVPPPPPTGTPVGLQI